MNIYRNAECADRLWKIIGNFGEFKVKTEVHENTFFAENGKISVASEISKHDSGIFVRTGRVKNISDEQVTLYTLSSKFLLDGGEYEVYSQYNGWQNESVGRWQPLVTSVYAYSGGVRSTHGAAPFMVLWSEQANRGTAFHLNAYSAWEMRLSRVHMGDEAACVEAEFGVMKDGLELRLAPGDEIELPEIIYYQVLNKTDMDCWKLHDYLNKRYPRKSMPVIYNTWLYKFDRFSFDDIMKQIERAKVLGVEYFVIDAGWFGKGADWWLTRGDWEENLTFGFMGRMTEIADEVRRSGMKFGFWLEPECASGGAEIVKKHPDYFIHAESSYFINFENPKAAEYIFSKTCELIDRFGAEFIKFDFNADLDFDNSRSGFVGYFKGHTDYVKKLKQKYPDLYLENCASGGTRMSIRDGMLYDSFWLSDNQSPYHGLRIFKDTVLRMPPQWVECWATICSAKKLVPVYGTYEYADKIIATDDATWNGVSGVHQSFLNGFLTGSPIGLSFDLTSLTEKTFCELKDFISDFKKKRDFWKSAVCHILTDTDTALVLEFRNDDFSKIEIVVFVKKTMQNNICIYPVLNEDYAYGISQKCTKSAKEIFEDGIDLPINESFSAQFLTLERSF